MAKISKPDLLYRAQTIGNIEPIEYMIPYPNTQSLIEGQTIKFGEQIIYKDYGITFLIATHDKRFKKVSTDS